MYYEDSREKHNVGRRYLAPKDQFSLAHHGCETTDTPDARRGMKNGTSSPAGSNGFAAHSGRRHIATVDHMSQGVAKPEAPGQHGHNRDDDVQDGQLARGIGHGRHHVGATDHISDAARAGGYSTNSEKNGIQCVTGHDKQHARSQDHMYGVGVCDTDSAPTHPHRRHLPSRYVSEHGPIGAATHHAIPVVDHINEVMLPVTSADVKDISGPIAEGNRRRYLEQTDHLMTPGLANNAQPGLHGHSIDDDVEDGQLQRGIGHGRHFIGAVDHMHGGDAGEYAEEATLGAAGHSIDDEIQDGLQRCIGHGKHHIDTKDHMANDGVAVPDDIHARGRRRLPSRYLSEDGILPEDNVRVTGRKHAIPIDHLKTEVLAPMTSADKQVKVSPDEMRNTLRDWLTGEFGMKIVDETKWRDVEVTTKGTHWLFSCLTNRGLTISREGATAQLIAEKISQLPVTQLRYFGVAFRPQGEPISPPTSQAFQNRSFQSQGVSEAFVEHAPERQEVVQGKKYISSGYDHFSQMNPDEATDFATYGVSRTNAYVGGLDRGIGHGVRHIPISTNFKDGLMPCSPGRSREEREERVQNGVAHHQSGVERAVPAQRCNGGDQGRQVGRGASGPQTLRSASHLAW